jgi:hypothetical protein
MMRVLVMMTKTLTKRARNSKPMASRPPRRNPPPKRGLAGADAGRKRRNGRTGTLIDDGSGDISLSDIDIPELEGVGTRNKRSRHNSNNTQIRLPQRRPRDTHTIDRVVAAPPHTRTPAAPGPTQASKRRTGTSHTHVTQRHTERLALLADETDNGDDADDAGHAEGSMDVTNPLECVLQGLGVGGRDAYEDLNRGDTTGAVLKMALQTSCVICAIKLCRRKRENVFTDFDQNWGIVGTNDESGTDAIVSALTQSLIVDIQRRYDRSVYTLVKNSIGVEDDMRFPKELPMTLKTTIRAHLTTHDTSSIGENFRDKCVLEKFFPNVVNGEPVSQKDMGMHIRSYKMLRRARVR